MGVLISKLVMQKGLLIPVTFLVCELVQQKNGGRLALSRDSICPRRYALSERGVEDKMLMIGYILISVCTCIYLLARIFFFYVRLPLKMFDFGSTNIFSYRRAGDDWRKEHEACKRSFRSLRKEHSLMLVRMHVYIIYGCSGFQR